MDNSIKVMRLEIDGIWTADDMVNSFSCLRDLYNLRLILQFEYEEWMELIDFYNELKFYPPFHKRFKRRFFFDEDLFPFINKSFLPLNETELQRIAALLYMEERLYVQRVKYGSKGIKDLAGVGEIIGHVKDFILEVIRLSVDRKKRALENEDRKLKNDQQRLQNAHSFVDLARKCGFKKSELRQIIGLVDSKQQVLVDLIDEGKLYDVKLLNPSENELDNSEN